MRCAVIGAGWWGTTAHVPALKGDPRADLIAIQHHEPETAARIARDFDVPHACTTLEEVLALSDLDAVVISSTAHLHHTQARAALQRDLHVLVEKPFTVTVREAEELVELAAQRGRQLAVGCTFHHTAHAAEARRLVRSGELGEIKMVSALMVDETLGLYEGRSWHDIAAGHPDPEMDEDAYLPPGRSSYSDPAIAGGGQIYGQVSHPASYLVFLTGDEPAEVHAHFDNAGTKVDVHNTLNIRMRRGTIVCLASSGAPAGAPRAVHFRIYGTEGALEQELFAGTMRAWWPGGRSRSWPDLAEQDIYPRYDPARNLLDAALGVAPNRSPGEVGLAAMRIIEAACASARSGRNVKLR